MNLKRQEKQRQDKQQLKTKPDLQHHQAILHIPSKKHSNEKLWRQMRDWELRYKFFF